MNTVQDYIEIDGKYVKTIFRNYKTGYSVFLFKPFNTIVSDGNLIKCGGIIPKYTEKMPITIKGKLTHNQESLNFEFVLSGSSIYVKTKTTLLAFLLSLPKCGIGKKKLEDLIEKFGEKLINEISENGFANELLNEKGITAEKLALFRNNILEYVDLKNILDFIQSYGGSYKDAKELYKSYGAESIFKLKENPYNAPMSFGICDSIGKKYNCKHYDSDRVSAIVSMAFNSAKEYGDCYFTYDALKKKIRQIEANQSAFSEWIPEAILLMEIIKCKEAFIEKSKEELKFYSKPVYYAEDKIARELLRLHRSASPLLSEQELESFKSLKKNKILDSSQINALNMLMDTDVSVLTGGPGTGKTTTIEEIVRAIKMKRPNSSVALCAPTGRAAERIQESTGLIATTIHRLLEYSIDNMGNSAILRNESNPLEEDFVIVDEFSMVGIFLFTSLLKSLKSGTKLILVGDANQLESLEPGALLEDIIQSNLFNVYPLTMIHRQDAENYIIKNSRKIAAMETDLETNENFKICKCENDEEALSLALQIAAKKYKASNIYEFHIISPIKKGVIGTYNLNNKIQTLFHEKENANFVDGNSSYYINDKVMTVRNNYDVENSYFNGDIGSVKDWNNQGIEIDLNDRSVSIGSENMDDLTLAYAMTVHKCQGSEGKSIVLLLSEHMPRQMLKNSILYTGVTRAKKDITIIYTGNALNQAILNKGNKRKTSLIEKMEKYK